MSLEKSTETQVKSSGYIGLMNVTTYARDTSLTISQARWILDQVKEGKHQHPILVTQALITTGDWYE